VTWEEIETAVDRADPKLLVFEIDKVLERVAEHGDLFAVVLSTRQRLAPP
jgi:DNA primase